METNELDFMHVPDSGIQCDHKGCESKDAFACFIDGDEPEEHLCAEHAPDAGYCIGCGNFYAGTHEFDFLHPGWCGNCHSEIRDND